MKKALSTSGAVLEGKLSFGSSDSIRVFPSRGGDSDLDDVSGETASAVADCIMDTVRSLAEASGNQIYASLSGGRKTVSALMMSCMTLLGRKQDVILHVLVNRPYDNNQLTPIFFFPEEGTVHVDRDGNTFNSVDAKISLTDVPFVRLYDLYKKTFVKNPPSYSELVKRMQNEVACPVLTFDYENASVSIDNEDFVKLSIEGFIVLSLIAKRIENIRNKLIKFQKEKLDVNDACWIYKFRDSNLFKKKEMKKNEADLTRIVSKIRGVFKENYPAFPIEKLLPKKTETDFPSDNFKFKNEAINPLKNIK